MPSIKKMESLSPNKQFRVIMTIIGKHLQMVVLTVDSL